MSYTGEAVRVKPVKNPEYAMRLRGSLSTTFLGYSSTPT